MLHSVAQEVETSTKRLFHTHGDGKLLIDFACFMIEESKSIILDRLNDFEHKLVSRASVASAGYCVGNDVGRHAADRCVQAMCAPEPAVQIAEGAQVTIRKFQL